MEGGGGPGPYGAKGMGKGGILPVAPPEKVLITHSSESISITPLIYGIEKGFYRKEAGGKRAISFKDVVAYSLLRRAAKEMMAER